MTSPVVGLGRENYINLTTFKRDGTPVATPVWLAPDGDGLVVITFVDTGKVKRLRHTPRVTITPCDMRGRVPAGAVPIDAVATVIDDPAEVSRLARLVLRRYPVLGRVLPLIQRLRGTKQDSQRVIRITAAV